MADGLGPRLAPCTTDVPAYATTTLGDGVPIGSYVGVPILRENGDIFGTLCALDPEPQPPEIARETALVELCANLLSSILWRDLKAIEQARHAERFDQDLQVDPVTEVLTRASWEAALESEESRCARYGHTASIFCLDLDGTRRVNESDGREAGDEYLLRAARSLAGSLRGPDLVARTGDDEFSVLAIECDASSAAMLARRLLSSLKKQNVSASLGFSTRDPGSGGLDRAWREAEQLMKRSKSLRRPNE
jgi:diguanylate cyclase (GGDEF)-like protein